MIGRAEDGTLTALAVAEEDERELKAAAAASEPGQTPPALEDAAAATAPPPEGAHPKKGISPWLLFGIVASLTLLGTALTVITKLMTIPMANYPLALTVETVLAYVPIALLYAMVRWATGTLDPASLRYPWKEVTAVASVFALGQWLLIYGTQYTSGPMQVLLSQAAIPPSMAISTIMLKSTYRRRHLAGALLVCGGILVSIGGQLGRSDGQHIGWFEGLWIVGYTLSWAPITLYTVYSELLYKKSHQLDPIIFTGIISALQLPFMILYAPAFAFLSRPPTPLAALPQNLWDGCKCLVSINTLADDDCWPLAPTFVLSNNLLNVILLLPSFACLEYGSSNLLWLACTLMVPLSNLAFSLPGIPDRTPATPDNGLALLIITLGLCVYGFSKKTALRMLGRVGLLASAADARRLDATVRSTQQEPPLQASAATSATTSSSSSWSLSPARPPPPSPAYEKEGAADKGPEEEGGQEQGWGWGWWSGLVGWGGRKRAGTEATTNRESFESTMTGTSRV